MKKLYEETAVQDIAAAIREKNGTATKYKVAEMGDAVRGITGAEEVAWHQCPEAVHNYLANVTYDPSDYSTSQIVKYAPATAVISNYKPIGKTVGGVTYYNEVPNVLTPFAGGGKAGTLKPLDALRWIRTRDGSAEAWNVRDLGGWACDGGTVKYGLLIRGGRISAADRAALVGQLGVQHEIDLRGREGRDPSDGEVATESPLGSDVRFTIADKAASYSLTPVATWQLYLRCVIDAVTHREPVYFHCTAGADRTGTLACVLEGLLGMSQSDIDKDYELTTFYSGSGTDALARRRNESEWKRLISAINAVSGDTFRDKCVHFAVGTCGMSMADINAFRASMIDGTPETVTADIATYSITKTLTDVTVSNGAASVQQYQPFVASITPTNGKLIESIKVTMGGKDVTAAVLRGSTDVLRRAVRVALTKCTSSNPRAYVIDGQSYCTAITADTGCEVSNVKIMMGGEDVSTFYKDGVIAIPEVIGDIVITATAVAQAPAYTNLLDAAIDMDGNVIGHTPMYKNMRYNSSSGAPVAHSGTNITGLLPVKKGDVVRIRWKGNTDVSYQSIKFFKSDRTQVKVGYTSLANLEKGQAGPVINFNAANGVADFKFDSSNGAAYFSIVLYDTLENVIVTTNEEII